MFVSINCCFILQIFRSWQQHSTKICLQTTYCWRYWALYSAHVRVGWCRCVMLCRYDILVNKHICREVNGTLLFWNVFPLIITLNAQSQLQKMDCYVWKTASYGVVRWGTLGTRLYFSAKFIPANILGLLMAYVSFILLTLMVFK